MEIIQAIEKAKQDFLIEAKAEASKEIGKQVQTDKASLITVFGIFASIISFLTIEFQFLRTVCSFEKLLGFTMILASLLLCFNLALDYLVKSRTDKETLVPDITFMLLITVFFVLGVYFVSSGNDEACRENKIHEKYLEEYLSQQKEFYKEYEEKQDKRFVNIDTKLKSIESRMK